MEQLIFIVFLALILTCILEMVPHFFLPDKKRWIKVGLICNIITNPLLNTFLMLLGSLSVGKLPIFFITIVLEFAIVFAEGGLYKLMLDVDYRQSLKVSAMCNGISFAVGLLINGIMIILQ